MAVPKAAGHAMRNPFWKLLMEVRSLRGSSFLIRPSSRATMSNASFQLMGSQRGSTPGPLSGFVRRRGVLKRVGS